MWRPERAFSWVFRTSSTVAFLKTKTIGVWPNQRSINAAMVQARLAYVTWDGVLELKMAGRLPSRGHGRGPGWRFLCRERQKRLMEMMVNRKMRAAKSSIAAGVIAEPTDWSSKFLEYFESVQR
ncbi:hypothetical protein Scep_006596 [Stephania cephalantha]|uniref:Uncharacterized protein n=1 Tax=Stephania cephalantha TaxID=152367 RepID=A0AAP0K9U2_9MAGN